MHRSCNLLVLCRYDLLVFVQRDKVSGFMACVDFKCEISIIIIIVIIVITILIIVLIKLT